MHINSHPSGKIIKSESGCNSFIPNPLPPKITWSDKLVRALSRADFALGKIAREGSKLNNTSLLINPFIIREATASSKIQGCHVTISEGLAYNAGINLKPSSDDIKKTLNYTNALYYGLERITDLPVSLQLIKEVHAKLTNDGTNSNESPGEFRSDIKKTLDTWSNLDIKKYGPPPVDELIGCLDDFEKFLAFRQLPPLIYIALCHYQFEAICPFCVENGQVGRLLISLLLTEQLLLPSPLLYLSSYFESTKDDYYHHMYNVSRKGAWDEWIIYFLNGVTSQSEDALSRAERINCLLENWRRQVQNSSSSVPVEIIKRLAANPYLTINSISRELDIAYSTAERGVYKLLGANIIRQISDGKRDKIYCATEILAILEEPAIVRSHLKD
ncbi:MAG: Fic/DOC family N-terminal domain-containing protein [Legionellaceae bacterium]|nr:Fic/DOC family N-terminal domain-containing protein [Legionellaceae bacterium]